MYWNFMGANNCDQDCIIENKTRFLQNFILYQFVKIFTEHLKFKESIQIKSKRRNNLYLYKIPFL